MSLLIAAGLGLAAAGAGASMFGGSQGGFSNTFTPAPFNFERGALNPAIWGSLNRQMTGQPTPADWRNRVAGQQAVRQRWLDNRRFAGLDFGARGLGDSGFQLKRQGQLLNQRAAGEADVNNQFFQNILARRLQATGQTAQLLAGARAGSGTFRTEG